MKTTSQHRWTGAFALLLLWITATPVLAQDDGPTPFDRRCGQCHLLADPGVLVPQRWLDRLGSMGTIDQLTADEQTELLSFFQHHGQEASKVIAMAQERRLFVEKCSLCHNPNRVFLQKLTDEQLADIVNRMHRRDPDWISADEADTILTYLKDGAPGSRDLVRQDYGDDVQGLFQDRCAACHTLERVYLMLERDRENAQWALTVKRMQARAPGYISDAEAEKITRYLEAQEPQLPPGQLPVPVE